MNKMEARGYVAVIDPSEQFLHLEDALQDQLAPNAVVGFDDPKAFLDAIQAPQMKKAHNWLIVVADSAALVENGVFHQTKLIWPEYRGLAFTGNPDDLEWRKIVANKEDIISKANPKAGSTLLRKIQECVNDFEDLLPGRPEGTIPPMGPDQSSKPEGKDAQQTGTDRAATDADVLALRPILQPVDQEPRPVCPIKLEELVRSESYLYRLLTKEKLNFIDRFFLREISCTLFRRLSRSAPERLADYERFLASETSIRHKPSWEIVSQQLRCAHRK
jgi:hypothetical protein